MWPETDMLLQYILYKKLLAPFYFRLFWSFCPLADYNLVSNNVSYNPTFTTIWELIQDEVKSQVEAKISRSENNHLKIQIQLATHEN